MQTRCRKSGELVSNFEGQPKLQRLLSGIWSPGWQIARKSRRLPKLPGSHTGRQGSRNAAVDMD
ncbi:MAG: hypothetical protein Fues2KO_19050 [Fuerstiella sp.]